MSAVMTVLVIPLLCLAVSPVKRSRPDDRETAESDVPSEKRGT